MAISFFNQLLNPNAIPKNIVAILSYLAIWSIFMLDVITSYQDQLQFLYFFPLFMIAFYDGRNYLIVTAVILSILFQAITLFTYGIPLNSTIIEILLVAFTNVSVTYLSRYARKNIMAISKFKNYYGPERRKENNNYWPERRNAVRG
jgi:hypothetical protein